MKKNFLFIGLIIFAVLSSGSITSQDNSVDPMEEDIKKAVEMAIQNSTNMVVSLFEMRVTNVEYLDGWGVVELTPYYPDKTVVPTEPDIAITYLSVDDRWVVVLPATEMWFEVLELLPDELLSEENKAYWRIQANSVQSPQAYAGYYLPWQAGQTKQLTRSISHGSGNSYYAFDFIDSNEPMFQLRAAKGGVVWYAQWHYPNGYWDGNANNANYLVIQNDIGLYDVYLHLAHESIPSNLRTRGAIVKQGDIIGNADDTGYSTGSHLHFMAHTNPSSWWGQSVDITFDDVSVCGGRPRKPSENSCASSAFYISGNQTDSTAPNTSHSLSGTAGQNGWYTGNVQVTVIASDNSGGTGVKNVQYKVGGGSWQTHNGSSKSFSVTNEGSTVVSYRAEDNVGNTSVSKSFSVLIDKTAPALSGVSLNNGSPETSNINVAVGTTASDSVSGLWQIRFSGNGSNWGVWQGYTPNAGYSIPANDGQLHTVYAQVRDRAGHISTSRSDSITLNLYPSQPTSSNYRLCASSFNSSGQVGMQSSSYRLTSSIGGNIGGGSSSSGSYNAQSGFLAAVQGCRGSVVNPNTANVKILPPTSAPGLGNNVCVPIEVSNLTEALGGFELTVTFPSDKLTGVSISDGGFLGSTGRTLVPIDNEVRNGTMMLAMASSGTAVGPTGSGTLAMACFTADAGGSVTIGLDASLTTTLGDAIESNSDGTQFTIDNCYWADFDCDNDVDISDIQKVIGRWNNPANYDSRYDFDQDGDIDYLDAQKVAAEWGWPNNNRPSADVTTPTNVTLSLDPASLQLELGQSTTIALSLSAGQDTAGFETTLTYDPAVLQIDGISLTNHLASTGRTQMLLGPDIDNNAGTATFGALTFGNEAAVNSGGEVAVITVTAVSNGVTNLSPSNSQVGNTNGDAQTIVGENGSQVTVGTGRVELSIYLPVISR